MEHLKTTLISLTSLLLTGCETMPTNDLKITENMRLNNYVVVNLENNRNPGVLRQIAKSLTFPLTKEDVRDIQILEAKFDGEENCAGLAAPQIGIAKKIIVFAAPENPDLKKFRSDFTQSMDKTVWLNPSYQGIGTEMREDYEACFSVENIAGPVNRYKKIRYSAQTVAGQQVEGEAEGFLARLIQHEIDHLNGKLFIDLVPKNKIMTMDDYKKMRAEAMASEGE